MTGNTFEIGARGVFRDLVVYELSYYHTELENELIAFENASLLTYYRNAGSSVRNGIEAVARVQAHDLVSVQGSFNYVKAEFEDYLLNGVQLGEACLVQDAGFFGNTGRCDVPGLIPTQAQASVRVGPSEYFVELGVEYASETQVNDANSAEPTEAYTLFDVRAGANALQVGRFEVSPFAGIQNLGDKTYVSSIAINAFGNRFYEPGPGRTFYVGATLAIAR